MLRKTLGSVCALLLVGLMLFAGAENALAAKSPTPSEPPASALTLYEELNALADTAFELTNQGNFAAAEKSWTEAIEKFPQNPAAWSNRGNSRVSQNKLDLAIADFNKAIEIAPAAPDPYLNRGTAYEGIGKFVEAIADYNHVLELEPNDPAAYNNRGNAEGGMGNWEAAAKDYQKAADMAPEYVFARSNYAIALYQLDNTQEAIRIMRNLVRKYPSFADPRAALTAALWIEGKHGEAESQWVAAVGVDARYKDIEWVKTVRRWSPAMVSALDHFLKLQS
jgi:tetratricopeptide (TPR) repeat protein